MRSEYKRLLKDTIRFLHCVPPRKPASSKPMPPPSTLKIGPLPVSMPAAEKPKALVPKQPQQTTFLILDKIQKHLPHLRLISSLPKSVGILGDKNEPFFLNLSKAIESRFCKVEWMEENEKDLTRFSLILGEKKLPVTHQILLEPIQHYQNNPNEKKQLWSQICHYLSQRYS